jgi:hypothetical protein
MKRKIIGILVCMLLIATAIPAVISIKINTINTRIPSHPQTSMGVGFMEIQKLYASDGAAFASFGSAVYIDGDTALIGAAGDDDNGIDSGSAYVFIRNGTTWTQQAKLLASDGAAGDQFGYFPVLDGDTALISAYYDDAHKGSAYVFTRSGTTWTEQQKLIASDGIGGAQFGVSVALQGDTAFIGANRDDDNGNYSGSVYVFTRSGITWTQQQKLTASDGAAQDRFGLCVAFEGDTALISAGGDDNLTGSAYIFTRNGTTWTQQQKIYASDGAAGHVFGNFISLDGDTAVIGAPNDDDNGIDSGSAYVFIRNGTTWTQQAKLLASDGAAGDLFSVWAVSLDGDTTLIGASSDDDMGTNSGSVYVFTRSGITWTQQQKLTASDGEKGDNFGITVALQDDTAFIGAYLDDDNGSMSGSAYVFTKTDLTFSITGGVGVKAEITNIGISDANDIPWQIHVEGGILGKINKTVNGTIDIPAGDTVIVKTGMLLGFGPISITAKVANEEQTATGTQLIIFSMVKK